MGLGRSKEAFVTYADDAFGHPRILSAHGPIFYPRARYSNVGLKVAVKKALQDNSPDKEKGIRKSNSFAAENDPCKT